MFYNIKREMMVMKNSDAKFLKDWEQTRQAGFVRYCITHGLAFGIILFVITGLFQLTGQSFTDVFFSLKTIYTLLIWLAGGIAGYGPVSWWVNEYLYRKKSIDLNP